jgi:hypothetical protein
MIKYLAIGIAVRLLLLLIGNYIDSNSPLPYTDIDYFVFTGIPFSNSYMYIDAATFVSNGQSPYERHTYRYTPLVAWILSIINGKLLFLTSDLVVYTLLEKIRPSVSYYINLLETQSNRLVIKSICYQYVDTWIIRNFTLRNNPSVLISV